MLVTGANGQVGHELLRVLVKQPSPSIPLRSEGGRKSPPSLAKGVAPQARGDAHLLRNEGGRRAAAGGCRPPLCKIVPATRTGALEDGTPCERVDLADPDGMRDALDRIAPDIILNAAAYTAVDRAEDEPELAQRSNGDAPGVLGAWAKQHGARVVHYSTDYVFDGNASRPYREDDATHPVSVYGRSKLAGELALRDSGARHLILRTAWVYAARGHNFLRTILRLGAERDVLRVVDDQIGAPTSARLIAEVTARVVAQWCAPPSAGRGSMRSIGGMPTLDGTYHLVTSGQTSWCGFARAIFERARAGGLLARAPTVEAIRTIEYPTKAARPAWSVLDTTKLRETFDIALPDWQHGLDEVIGELTHS
ncbi:MAG: dTDP-4-dehydrorhamnose reductase [Rhodanobacteraceae bacterium]|nr:MAG: dTDP-4-dehydrorhamnose reductase [Rhodanobacteraceae bacterium]